MDTVAQRIRAMLRDKVQSDPRFGHLRVRRLVLLVLLTPQQLMLVGPRPTLRNS